MAIWDIIPTCNDLMSRYTLVALCAFATIGFGVVSATYWWVSREFARLRDALKGHDEYIDDTAKLINKMGTDIAVTRESVKNIEDAITETKTSISGINRTLIDKLIDK